MFPPDLEFIDDADVVTLPDGTVKLVTDKQKTGPSSVASSQVSRDTIKMAPADSVPSVGEEAINATDNSTAQIIKMLRRRQAPVPASVIHVYFVISITTAIAYYTFESISSTINFYL